jgi:RNA polymerase sigma-70 factor (ECF subfamily)
MPEDTDSMLIQSAIKGDEQAFAELIKRYQAAVWGTVYRTLGNFSEAEDAVQEIFLRALVSLKRFNRKYPFGPWILRIAGNYCIDQLRRRKTRKHRLWSDLSETEQKRIMKTMATNPETDRIDPEDASRNLEIARILLDRLKPRRRIAFVLRVIEGHSYNKVAEILGVPETTARVRVYRARTDLEKAFNKHLADLKGESENEEPV